MKIRVAEINNIKRINSHTYDGWQQQALQSGPASVSLTITLMSPASHPEDGPGLSQAPVWSCPASISPSPWCCCSSRPHRTRWQMPPQSHSRFLEWPPHSKGPECPQEMEPALASWTERLCCESSPFVAQPSLITHFYAVDTARGQICIKLQVSALGILTRVWTLSVSHVHVHVHARHLSPPQGLWPTNVDSHRNKQQQLKDATLLWELKEGWRKSWRKRGVNGKVSPLD